MAAAFAELREYRREHAGPTLKPTDEGPLEQLLLPRDAMTRLCLFSTPLDVLPFYREHIFPLAEAAGFVPVTEAEVVNLSASVTAKLDTLIDRAAVMVVDATSQSTQFELAMAVARAQEASIRPNRQQLRLVLVVTDYAQVPVLSSNPPQLRHPPHTHPQTPIVERPVALSELSADSAFVGQLGEVFQSLSEQLGLPLTSELQRLFEAREYRAAVIAAMTLLEATLRQRLNDQLPGNLQGLPMSLRQLLDIAAKAGIAVEWPREEILGWIRLRNEAVHTARNISRNEAKDVVEGVESIVASWR